MKSRDTLLILAALMMTACDDNSSADKGGPRDKGGPADTDPPVTGEVLQIWINEVMAQNNASWADESGTYPDWVELYNPNDQAVDLSGWWMSDDADDPYDWKIPDGVTIPEHGYLIVFCDDDVDEGPLHASFHIGSTGSEDVILLGPNSAENPVVDLIEDMSIQAPDISLARMPDGGPTLAQDDTPTPAAPNN